MFCTLLVTILNIILDPILIFTMGMGCGGAGAATAIAQWIAVLPQLYLLNRTMPFSLLGGGKGWDVLKAAAKSYYKAGSLVLLRTIAKIACYTYTASAAARLGTIPMAGL